MQFGEFALGLGPIISTLRKMLKDWELEVSRPFSGDVLLTAEFSCENTWWDVSLSLVSTLGPDVWNVTFMDMDKKVLKCFWKKRLGHQVPDPEEDDGKMEPSKVEAARN